FAELAGFSPSHRRHIYQFLRAALRDAVRADLLDQNPMDAVDPPRGGAVRPAKAWKPEEVARFLEASKGHRLYPLFALMLATGLRPGEALALRWEDWEGDVLHV
ncbi:site-specific integrase, partial [Acinetobacter baumannii]